MDPKMQSQTRKSPAISRGKSVAENELLREWFETLQTKRYVYKESFLDKQLAEFVKFSCDTLKQDSHVFIMSVDMLEEYVAKQDRVNPMLVVVTVIFIANKFAKAGTALKIKHLESFLNKILNCQFSKEKIRETEVDVLVCLKGKLPLTTRIDDLKTFLEVCREPLNLETDIPPLCTEILNMLYISMQNFFDKLKQHYLFNATAQKAFKSLFTNKLYLPVGIILCALQMTRCTELIDLDEITLELSEIARIHVDHIKLLTEHIITIMRDTKS